MAPKRDLSDRFARSGGTRRRRDADRAAAAVRRLPGVAQPPIDSGAATAESNGPTVRPVSPPSPATSRAVSTFAARRQNAVSNVQRARVSPLNTDYAAVRSDLRKIAVLAAGIFAVLVVLTFLIR